MYVFTTRALLLFYTSTVTIQVYRLHTGIQTIIQVYKQQSIIWHFLSRSPITSNHSHHINIDTPHNYTAESTTYRYNKSIF